MFDTWNTIYCIIVVLVIILNLLPSKKDYKKTWLDRVGAIINVILTILYVPASFVIFLFSGFLYDDPSPSGSWLILRNVMLTIFMSVPIISGFCILSSIVLRKIGRSKISFFIQFFPIIYAVSVFILLMIFG